jgi:hypothetical protein
LEIARDPKHLGAEIGFFSVVGRNQIYGNGLVALGGGSDSIFMNPKHFASG